MSINFKTQNKSIFAQVNAHVTETFNKQQRNEPYKKFIDANGCYVVCQTREELIEYNQMIEAHDAD